MDITPKMHGDEALLQTLKKPFKKCGLATEIPTSVSIKALFEFGNIHLKKVMDSFGSICIFGRRKKTPLQEDLRSMIAAKIAARLRCEYIGVIGAEMTGRNTLVRRFLHMSDGPFMGPEDEKYNRRCVLIELSERPSIRQAEVVKLNIYILNGRTRSYEDLNHIIPKLKSIAMVFDVRSERTVNVAISCANRIRARLGEAAPPFIMIGNKIDLPVSEETMTSIREQANGCGAASYYECSALKNTNMDRVLDALLILTFFPDRSLPQ